MRALLILITIAPLAAAFAYWIINPPRGIIPAIATAAIYIIAWTALWIFREQASGRNLRNQHPEVYDTRTE